MNKTNKAKGLLFNTIMMYLMNISKIIIPLISLPYLTRVLSVDTYGSVSFVKSFMSYFTIFIDFGFLLSATKDIVALLKNREDIGSYVGNTLLSKLILVGISFLVLSFCCIFLNVMRGFEIFAFLYLISVSLSIFMHEYIFKAYEQMDKIAIRFVIMKTVSLILTLMFVKGDKDVILIPIFEILSSLVAVIMVQFQIKKMHIKVKISFRNIKQSLKNIKISFVYFVSDFASTAFGALNTLLIGIFLLQSDVAFWSLAFQIAVAIQALYTPIINSVYPKMLKEKNLKIIHRIMLIYMPLILCGCGLILLLGDWAITLIFTKAYLKTSLLLKCMIPLLIFSFPAMLYGWPCLAPINKQKLTTMSTIVSAGVQVVALLILGLIGQFNIISIAIVRNLSELTLCAIRMGVCYKNKKLFTKEKEEQET